MQKEQNVPALPGVTAILKRRRQQRIVTFAAAAIFVLAVAGTLYYWRYARFIVSTDDAYAQADSTILASRVSGYVAAVQVEDDQHIKTGQIIARIDDRDYRATLDQSRADVQAAEADVTNLLAQLAQQDALIAHARASVAAKGFPPFSAYAGGVEVSYDLDLFAGTRRRIERVGAEAQYETAMRDAAALSISGNVVLQALQLASLSEQIRVVEGIVADDERMLRLIRAANEAGAVSRMDVLSAQSQTDHDRTLLPPLRQQLAVSQDTLAILVGAAPADWPAQDFSLQQITLHDEIPAALPSELVHRRPDIAAAEAQLHAASASVGIATANLYPHLTLDGTIGREGLLGGGPSETAWNVIGGLSAPIFHGGTLNAQRRAAVADYEAAFGAYRETVLEAFGQVADMLQALTNDSEALDTQQRALESARASLDLTRRGYEGGNAGYVQVLDAQRLHQEAQLGIVQAATQSYVDTVKLLLAAGGQVGEMRLGDTNPSRVNR